MPDPYANLFKMSAMKFFNTVLILLLLCSRIALATPNSSTEPTLNNHPAFKENRGQVVDQYGKQRSDVHFQFNDNSTSVFIGLGEIHYQWNQIEKNEENSDTANSPLSPININSYRLDMELVGCSKDAHLIKENPLPDFDIYHNASLNGVKVLAYQKIIYQNIYPNIDWVLYFNATGLKYDFIVRPGGNVSDIQIRYDGQSDIVLQKGAVTIFTPFGSLTEQKPYSFIAIDNKEVRSQFILKDNLLKFQVDIHDGTLVIDPELRLEWGTYYGGSGPEYAQYLDYSFAGYSSHSNNVLTDKKGDVYMCGSTMSVDNIATTGAFQVSLSNNGSNAFLVKFNPQGQRLWATYYGGGGGYISPDNGLNYGTVSGRGHSIACDTLGNIYMAGITWNNNGIATPGAYQPALNGTNGWPDLYLVKFHDDGVREWATYFGNSMIDEGGSIAVTPNGSRIYLAGASKAHSPVNDVIASPGAAFPPQSGQWSQYTGFLTCFNSLGQKQWGTYIADVIEVDCTVFDIATNNEGFVYLTGYVTPRPGDTNSIANAGSFQAQYSGGVDAFLQKWDSLGNRIWGTYYGGNQMDIGYGITCGENDEVYVSGTTMSAFGPINGLWSIASQGSFLQTKPDPSDFDNYLAKFSGTGQRAWGTYYGAVPTTTGTPIGYRRSALAYKDNQIFMLYTTIADSLATPCAYQVSNPGIYNASTSFDAHLAIFDVSGQRKYATYYGGLYTDFGLSIAVDSTKNGTAIYIAGTTYSPTGIATTGSYKSVMGSQLSIQRDAFLAKFMMPRPLSIEVPCFKLDSVYIIAGDTSGSGYQWSDGETHFGTWVETSGTYVVNYQKANGCPGSDTFLVSIYPMPLFSKQKECIGKGTASAAVLKGNTNIYNYEWSKESGELIAGRQSNNGDDLSGLLPDNYSLLITTGNCDTTILFTIEAFPEVVLTAGGDTTVAAGNSARLWAAGASQYKWEPEQWLDNPWSATPITKPEAPITYSVTGYNEYGCKATLSVDIDINDKLFLPNAFSPNGDGLNDEFNIGNIGYQKLIAFRVFNRFGEEVFSTTNPKQGWKGDHKGKPADLGVYFYYINIIDIKGREKILKGDVSLIR